MIIIRLAQGGLLVAGKYEFLAEVLLWLSGRVCVLFFQRLFLPLLLLVPVALQEMGGEMGVTHSKGCRERDLNRPGPGLDRLSGRITSRGAYPVAQAISALFNTFSHGVRL